MKNNWLMCAVLSVSTLSILCGTAVSPALAGIQAAFPEQSSQMIQLVIILPSLMIVPTSLLSGSWSNRFGAKRVLTAGILIYLFGGAGAVFAGSFKWMLAFRVLLGIGSGVVIPFAQSLIPMLYDGELRERMIGYSASSSYLMGMIAALLAGNLAAINWRYPFLIYLFAVPVLILTLKYIPPLKSPSPSKKIKGAKDTTRFTRYNKALVISGCMCLLNVAFYTFSTSIALFMRQDDIGSITSSSTVVFVFMLSGFLTGIWLSRLRRWLHGFSEAAGLLMMAVGFGLLTISRELLTVHVAGGLIGASYSILYPAVFLQIGKYYEGRANAIAISIATAGLFLGQCLSPSILSLAEQVFNQQGFRFHFLFLSCCLTVAFAATGFWQFFKGTHKTVTGESKSSATKS